MDCIARVENVTLRRGDTHILSGVSLALHEGQRWALLGPNGAGKTSLLSLFAAREHPTSGRVEVLGKQLGRYPIQDLWPHIGTVSSRHQPGFRMPAHEVVLSGRHGANTTPYRWIADNDTQARARELEEDLGIAHVRDHWWDTLSTGEQRRVLLARALLNEPHYLLLDEPAAGLDFPAREQLLLALDSLVAERPELAVLMVTHHLEELPTGTTHAALLRSGALLAAGPVDAVVTDALLSECYGFALTVHRRLGRWSAQAAS